MGADSVARTQVAGVTHLDVCQTHPHLVACTSSTRVRAHTHTQRRHRVAHNA